MDDSPFGKAFRAAPMTTVAGVAYGLEHAPSFTINLLHAFLFEAVTQYQAQIENADFTQRLVALMSKCGPWQHGPETAAQSRASLERLPVGRRAVTLLDPYYFDLSMIHADPIYETGLVSYGYRLHPCGVFAANYDFTDDDALLTDTVMCFAFLRGEDLLGNLLSFTAIWREGLPLGAGCAFNIPRWGTLRRAHTQEAYEVFLCFLRGLCREALESGCVIQQEVMTVLRRVKGEETLPTPIEHGFPNLAGTVWFGSEPFPVLEAFELELIGADHRERRVSVPQWFRAARSDFG